MLALHENALIAALDARPGIKLVARTIGSIPDLPTEKLLAQYQADAPATYVVSPRLVADDSGAVMHSTIVIMVRNVASRDQARKGNQVEVGIDQLFTLVCRAINGKRIGEATWYVRRAEFADDDLFVKQGLTVLEVAIDSSRQDLPYEWDPDTTDMQLDDLKHFHADFDIVPFANASEYAKWLETPPNYTTSRPDAQAELQLAGGSQ